VGVDPVTEPPAAPSPPSWADHLARWRDALSGIRPSVAVAAGATLAAVTVAAALLLFGRSTPRPAVVLPRADPAVAPTTADAGGAERGQATDTVTVHAAGALVRPGIYVLPAAARVADAVAAAGGASPEADLDQLNLATRLGDGDRVYVPRKGETAAALPGPSPGSPAGEAPATTRAQVIDLNIATADQLEALPGVGPSLAAAIVEHRTRHGRFRSVDDLVDVPGIGPAKLAALRPLVRV
jgi:competence protein ComEA